MRACVLVYRLGNLAIGSWLTTCVFVRVCACMVCGNILQPTVNASHVKIMRAHDGHIAVIIWPFAPVNDVCVCACVRVVSVHVWELTAASGRCKPRENYACTWWCAVCRPIRIPPSTRDICPQERMKEKKRLVLVRKKTTKKLEPKKINKNE